jgi:hypothetical protein
MALAICSLGWIEAAHADPSPLDARLLGSRGDRVYVALDSVALAPGTRLTFTSRGKILATAEVVRVYDAEIAVATLTSGSFRREKNLERVRILAEPVPRATPRRLQIGYPTVRRARLLFPCARMSLTQPPGAGYRTETPDARTFRLVREEPPEPSTRWPDTLVIRLFEDAGDEEIALERGELDVAVFLPGELSSHMREQPAWQPLSFGTRSDDVIAAFGTAGALPVITSADSLRLAELNRELFRGDLGAVRGTVSGHFGSPSPGELARFEVDPSLSNARTLERFLNRERATAGSPRTLRLAHFGQLTGATRDSLQVAPLFVLRYPVLRAPRLHGSLSALEADAFVRMLGCAPESNRP